MRTVPDGGTTLNAVHSVQGQVRLKQLDLTACIAMVPVVPLLLQVLWARRHLQASIFPSLPASHCTGTLAVPLYCVLQSLDANGDDDSPAGSLARRRRVSVRGARGTPQRLARKHCSAERQAQCLDCRPHSGHRLGWADLSAASLPAQEVGIF